MSLELERVSFGYGGGPRVVSEVTAELAPGRFTAVLGPNAAGKTTLLRLMLGQLAPQGGSVALEGEAVSSMAPRRRARRISYVPQRGAVSFAFTVRRVVAMGRYAHGEAVEGGEAVTMALSRLGLTALADRPFVELSGGQQQRVLLARAVAQSARGGSVMLLDEPAAGLDLRHVHEALSLVRELAGSSGLAVAVVLHDLSLAARYADDVWVMHEGRLAQSGPWEEVMRPEVLEPVYGVRLRRLELEAEAAGGVGAGRPVFVARPEPATLDRVGPGS